MSMPKGAERKLQTGLIRELMNEYQQTGEVNADKLSDAVATAFAEGLTVNNEYYETYKHVKDYLRTTPVTISEQDQADIADFTQFKKRAFGTLRIVKQGGTPVDVMYQEVQEMAPGLLKPETQYAQYRRAVYGLTSDKDKNGEAISGSKKKKVLTAINKLKISNKLKDALYFASGYGESTLDDAP